MGYSMVMNVPYPFWVKVVRDNMNKTNPALASLDGIVLPWPGSLSLRDTGSAGLKTTTLLSSSPFSWTQPYYNLNPRQQFQPSPDDTHSRTLAALVTGKFTSAYKNKEAPRNPATPAPGMVAASAEPPRIDEGKKDGALMVVPDAMFVSANFLRLAPVNLSFVLNVIDQVAFGNSLISLRVRGARPRVLQQDLNDQQKTTVKYLNLVGVPVVLALFAFARGILRRRRKNLEV
jgi:ABC-type uncharacterized transport system involved in gliding motility auxiliary subunit